jgi:hypothetical protein
MFMDAWLPRFWPDGRDPCLSKADEDEDAGVAMPVDFRGWSARIFLPVDKTRLHAVCFMVLGSAKPISIGFLCSPGRAAALSGSNRFRTPRRSGRPRRESMRLSPILLACFTANMSAKLPPSCSRVCSKTQNTATQYLGAIGTFPPLPEDSSRGCHFGPAGRWLIFSPCSEQPNSGETPLPL